MFYCVNVSFAVPKLSNNIAIGNIAPFEHFADFAFILLNKGDDGLAVVFRNVLCLIFRVLLLRLLWGFVQFLLSFGMRLLIVVEPALILFAFNLDRSSRAWDVDLLPA
jgi:hypothetical protein